MFPAKEDGLLVLLEELLGNSDGAIERQEKRGQDKLINSETLPRRFNYGSRDQLEQEGVVYGEDADDLFAFVILPVGWRKEPTDHSMWSRLLDDKGRERATIFYKATFYDRDAFVNLSHRYMYSVRPIDGWENSKKSCWHCIVTDADEIIWKSDVVVEPKPPYSNEKYNAWMDWFDRRNALGDIGKAWLNEYFPDWNDPTAYWEK